MHGTSIAAKFWRQWLRPIDWCRPGTHEKTPHPMTGRPRDLLKADSGRLSITQCFLKAQVYFRYARYLEGGQTWLSTAWLGTATSESELR